MTQACHANATCTDQAPPSTTRTCACNAGFEGNGITACSSLLLGLHHFAHFTDINACLTEACHANATCTDQAPPLTTRTCACNAGFEGNGITACSSQFLGDSFPADSADINACLTQACHANATCTDQAPPSTTRTCACNAGYSGDGVVCSRGDACLVNTCHGAIPPSALI